MIEDEETKQGPVRLGYAEPALVPVSDARFRGAAALLVIGVLLLALGCGAVGLFFVDRLGGVAAAMIGSAVAHAVAILGYLSVDRPRFGAAMVVLAAGLILAGLSAWLAWTGYDAHVRAIYAAHPGQTVIRLRVTDAEGGRLASLEIARVLNLALAAGSGLLVAYVAVRFRRLRMLAAT